MMNSQRSSFVEDKDEKYAHLWFASFCKFHKIPDNESQQWDFDNEHVLLGPWIRLHPTQQGFRLGLPVGDSGDQNPE